jgi:hypothetical protein
LESPKLPAYTSIIVQLIFPSEERHMSWLPAEEPEKRIATGCRALETIVVPRPRDIGGFEVRRVLPSAERRNVGPFVFFDQMGPADLAPGSGIDVRPHPHIGLATVTYLFEGTIVHRDSLGSVQSIEPGAVNWMTAGRGIAHSERSDNELRKARQRLYGIQIWVALPKQFEETTPDFTHYGVTCCLNSKAKERPFGSSPARFLAGYRRLKRCQSYFMPMQFWIPRLHSCSQTSTKNAGFTC